MIAFACSHCGAQLQVKESMAGKTGPCPGCSQVVQVPAATPSSSGPTASSGRKSAARASGQRTVHAAAEETTSPTPRPAVPTAPPRDYPFLAPPQRPDELGRLGSYRVLKVLGTGAMGVVFQAEDLSLKRQVALKVMKPALAAFPDFHRRFLREAVLAAALDHEHIITVYQVSEDRGVPFLAMRLLQGETMEDRLNRSGGRLPLPEVLRIGREIAEGLGAAHAGGLVHRDVKPANIWLEAGRDRVKILDFGLARGTGEDAHFTQAGAVIGTPAYMAPEQANGEEVDGRCDLFGLGAVLYRACTGQLPFGDKDTLSVLKALATTTPESPHRIDPSLPQGFSDLVMWLLTKDRDARPQSAREVVEALTAIERGDIPEGPPTLLEEIPPEEVPAPRPRTEPVPPPAPQTERVRASEPAGSGVKRKGPKKPSPPRRKKRAPGEPDWGRRVLVASLVLLALSIVVLLLGLLRHASRTHGDAARHPDSSRFVAVRAG